MFGLEPLLRARLAEVPGLIAVHGAPAAIDDGSARRPTPCVFVIWAGYKVLQTSTSGRSARVASHWHVVLAIKNAADPADGLPARSDATPLLQAVIGKLLGWNPGAGYGPLALADDAPGPSARGGILRFPIAVKSEVVVHGD